MLLKEALDYLKTRGFITEDTDTLQDEFDSFDKNHSFPTKREFDVYSRISRSSLKDKISNAKTYNMMNNIKTYEKQLLAKLKEAGLKITGSNPDSQDKRLTQYDVEINDKGEIEEGYVCLYVEDGELMVNYELFSGINGTYTYEEFINAILPWEIKNFKKYAEKSRYF